MQPKPDYQHAGGDAFWQKCAFKNKNGRQGKGETREQVQGLKKLMPGLNLFTTYLMPEFEIAQLQTYNQNIIKRFEENGN